MLGSLWAFVNLDAPPLEEQLTILTASFPTLPPEIVSGGMATLLLCQTAGGLVHDNSEAASLPQGWNSLVESALSIAELRSGEFANAFGRHFSLRDMFKLCFRLQASAAIHRLSI